MFITDDEKITWHDVIKSLIPVAECIEPVGVTREELRRLHATNGKSSFSVMRSLKHVVSREVRAALRKDPFWAKLEEGLSQGVTRLGKVVEERLRLSIAGPQQLQNLMVHSRIICTSLPSSYGECGTTVTWQSKNLATNRFTRSQQAWRPFRPGIAASMAWTPRLGPAEILY
jgi:hypothetical protein